ncbi:[protein-PII] uridylyltransferase, partial [bacterium]|nr:[protein-PII] uridylyltransferase [bacterium]
TIQASFYNADPPTSMAVIATGGYGRRELFPFSDVDLLVLYDRKSAKEIAGVVDNVLYPLWDSGMVVGHSVRTKKECLIDAKNDFHFQVSLLDARVVCGSKELFQDLKNGLDSDILA